MTTKLLSIFLMLTFLAASVFAVGASPRTPVQSTTFPVGQLVDGAVYSINNTYVAWDPLFSFVKNGNQFQFSSNCAYVSGCDYYGLWKNPYTFTQTSVDTYDLFYINSSVHTHYQIKVLPTGNAKVYVSNDQCYPSGCKDPPLHLIGIFSKH